MFIQESILVLLEKIIALQISGLQQLNPRPSAAGVE